MYIHIYVGVNIYIYTCTYIYNDTYRSTWHFLKRNGFIPCWPWRCQEVSCATVGLSKSPGFRQGPGYATKSQQRQIICLGLQDTWWPGGFFLEVLWSFDQSWGGAAGVSIEVGGVGMMTLLDPVVLLTHALWATCRFASNFTTPDWLSWVCDKV